jgi:integrase
VRGWIEKRVGKRGVSYRIRIDKGLVEAKRKQPSQTFRTKKEAEAALAKWVSEVSGGTFVEPSDRTLGQYLTEWLETVSQSVRPPTLRRYRDLATRHVIPQIGSIRLDKLSALDLQRHYAERLRSGLSPTTVRMIHMILHHAIHQAVRWGILTRNVTELTNPPRRAETEFAGWDTDQVASFLVAADEDDYAPLWRLAVFVGLRRGELLGLHWSDIDLERGMLRVSRTYSRTADGNWGEGAPKTRSSRRTIALPISILEALRAYRVRQLELRLSLGGAYRDQGYVFTTLEGRPLHVNSLMLRFQRLTKEAKLPVIRFHDLRHTSASLSLAEGTHPKIVQERLGHSTIQMTIDRYTHSNVEMQRREMERLERLIEERRRREPEGEPGQL